jgi:hypothetical protein
MDVVSGRVRKSIYTDSGANNSFKISFILRGVASGHCTRCRRSAVLVVRLTASASRASAKENFERVRFLTDDLF